MVLTKKQEEGLKIAIQRHKDHEKYTVISGYAGSGKSTLVKFIIAALEVEPDRVAYATFTGKAAEVLRKKGNQHACTLHRLLYDSVPKAGGGFFHKPKTSIGKDIVVIDEISMVPKEMVDLLFKHQCYIICLGDPFQLPPIDKEADNHLLDHPHVFLDEIMRQAADSEIIRLSMDIREQKPLSLYSGTNVKIIDKNQLVSGMLTWADEILVAKNLTRQTYNQQVRQLLGKGAAPEDGDKVICLRNYWDEVSAQGEALVNGTIGYLQLPHNTIVNFPRYAKTSVFSVEGIEANINLNENDYFSYIIADKKMLLTGEESLDWRDKYALGRLKGRIGDIVPKEFAYGYAVTCHKAQGSEWDKVLVIEENFPFDKIEHARWLYTAVTRAADKLVLVRQ